MILSPFGTVRERFARSPASDPLPSRDPDLVDLAYLAWDVARAARLPPSEQRALGAVCAATLAAMRAGSTRIPVDARLEASLALVAAADQANAVRTLVERARQASPGDALLAIVGRPGERTPLVLDGDWLYAERMRTLDERFTARVRSHLARTVTVDAKAVNKALKAVVAGPPALTDEQKRAVKEGLTSSLALVTGGPGTGKTTIVVALLRALAWSGVPMGEVAIAAPTGKAAQRLQVAIDAGLAGARRDMAEATLHAIAPAPQTLHRLLGWSPTMGRFARHENDPLPHRVVVVDEASMIDLAMMDRLVRAMRPDARLVLLGDADQLPSVEAGAVFRDLCASLDVARLTTNLRVASDPSARRIVDAAAAVNRGDVGTRFADAVRTCADVASIAFDGPEHLALSWSQVEETLLERWWSDRIEPGTRAASRTFHAKGGVFAPEDAAELRALLEHHASSRLLCATRGDRHGADAINARLLSRAVGGLRVRRWQGMDPPAGTPVVVQRNDYARRLFNGDQGVVVRVAHDDAAPRLQAVFARGASLEAFALDAQLDWGPAFAMTVHKSQGSEYDHVALVLPDADLPLLTRELVYTALTRARRSALVIGSRELLARAVSKRIERYTGIAERLAETAG
jgi:exodeoxyribonuclease V alpha subunit